MPFHFQFLAWTAETEETASTRSTADLLEVLHGLSHRFTNILSWRRGAIFKVELKKSVSWTPATSSQMFHSHGQFNPQDPQGLPKLPPTLRLRGLDTPTQKGFVCETQICLFISVSIARALFWIFPISVQPCCKKKQQPPNPSHGTCPKKNAANECGDKTCLGGCRGLLLMHICRSWLWGAVWKPLGWEWRGAAESVVVPTFILLSHLQEYVELSVRLNTQGTGERKTKGKAELPSGKSCSSF